MTVCVSLAILPISSSLNNLSLGSFCILLNGDVSNSTSCIDDNSLSMSFRVSSAFRLKPETLITVSRQTSTRTFLRSRIWSSTDGSYSKLS